MSLTAAPTANTHNGSLKSSFQAWSVVLVAALFFFYEFIQMNLFNAINDQLRSTLHLSATVLGEVSLMYFIANVVFLFPAGVIIDRFSTRKVILISMLFCIVGTVLFAGTTSTFLAMCYRFLTGIGSAFCFVSVVRLASRWFAPERLAMVIGVVVTLAMTGGVVANTPLMLLAKAWGWRNALYLDGLLGVVLFILILCIVRDHPKSYQATHELEQAELHQLGYLKSMRIAFFRAQNWCAALFTSLMNLPIGVLGGLWGVNYLVANNGFTPVAASEISSMLFVGTIVGSPLVGWISDTLGKRVMPMFVGAVLSLTLCVVMYDHAHVSQFSMMILFFLLGVTTSCQIISYALVAETNSRMVTAMAVSVVSIATQGGVALYQYLFSHLLDQHQLMRLHHISQQYTADDFKWAILMIPVGFVIAMLLSACVKEKPHADTPL